MSAYTRFGQDLYEFIDELDISGINDEWSDWVHSFNRPPKADELTDYPSFAVVPTRDTMTAEDSITDSDSITYSVFIFVRYWEASVSEPDIRALVDKVRTELRKERREASPLGGAYTITFAGEWGGDEAQMERFYRLDVTATIAEEIE